MFVYKNYVTSINKNSTKINKEQFWDRSRLWSGWCGESPKQL